MDNLQKSDTDKKNIKLFGDKLVKQAGQSEDAGYVVRKNILPKTAHNINKTSLRLRDKL